MLLRLEHYILSNIEERCVSVKRFVGHGDCVMHVLAWHSFRDLVILPLNLPFLFSYLWTTCRLSLPFNQNSADLLSGPVRDFVSTFFLIKISHHTSFFPGSYSVSNKSLQEMSVDMSALSEMQIRVFFENNSSVTQKQCDDRAQEVSGQPVSPTTCQGGSSYTVAAGDNIIQFRTPGSLLNMGLIGSIEQAYLNFTPRYKDCGPFHNLRIYTMNNIEGESIYIARGSLYKDNYKLLRNTIDSFAEFVNTFLPMLSFLEHRSLGRIHFQHG